MQSTLYSSSSYTQFHYQWKVQNSHFPSHRKPVSKQLRFSIPKALTLTNSLRTSINYEPEEGLDNGPGPGPMFPVRLPVVVRNSGRVSRYMWDGSSVKLVSVDGGAASCVDFEDGYRKLFRALSLGVRDFFIPKQVTENYMDYVKWKLLHRVFSSALQVLATQAMFRAVGIGYSRSLPSAAALNWVLKDGLGRLSRCIYTASLASAFDTNLKRVRFSTSILFSLGIGLELLTPAFPKQFLLLATIANIAKQISLACHLATGSAIHRSFAVADNLGEVSAKAQIQTVCFDNLGLMLAALLNMLFKNNQRLLAGLPFVVYPIFSAIDLFGIYQGLKHVHLQTLTKDRLEMILDSWIALGRVPTPAEVSKKEGFEFLRTKGKELWPIRIGCLNAKDQISKLSVIAMQSLSSEDYYFICVENSYRGLTRTKQQGILLSLREGAGTADVIMGLLQACYIRKALLFSRWETISDPGSTVHKECIKLIEDSKQSAEKDLSMLGDQMTALGWAVKNILLSTEEQTRYSFVDD
ncbi:protein root UVB sensitive 4 [Ricinus communis]|uniref:mRNA n=1 Tax=Ricinus communis TaxID=3988 RepID=B9S8Q2_RICCO|nr:protein root UVB sensitive 4 [Ricinus communis]EEF40055.1 mRNA, complete cds, clone: rafl24-09-C04, putative [Ricinus communis]|eukprot:XP_002522371.1 protein root UVB sensitive 4 [Ricinus communis]